MAKRALFLLACIIVWCLILQASSAEGIPFFGPLIPKESRRTLIATESGVITAVNVFDGLKGAYHLQFFTLEPSSLFLPVLLHTDMVFYVQTGRGTVSWTRDESKDGTTNLDVERGDVYRLEEGSIFYIRSHPDPAREKLRIHAIFNNFNFEDPQEPSVGVYSNVSDLVHGFDDRVLQMGFKASEEDVQAIKWAIKPPPIVHFAPNKTEKPNWTEVFETLMGGRNPISLINGKKKKKTKTNTFNVFKETPDVKNCNGWSVAVTNRDLSALKHSNIGVFMVNLTKGSMMGPHWNPKATEIATVIEGQGMVQIVCASNPSGSRPTGLKCENMRFKVREGDVFIVPRFHPMAHMSFNNESLVFMGFSTSVKNNHPQYLAGKWSVLRTIDRDILAVSMGASNASIEKILVSQDEGVLLECTSCAEEVEKTMEEEIERRREEEEEARRKREEEEAKKREEEEAKKREEEEKKKREEEEKKKREEEEARKREEEEAKRKEEEEEEIERRREEEEARRKKEEEEEARKREEEEKKKREEEEARKREEEEAKRKEEEETRKREEEEAMKREEEKKKREEEEARKREEEEAKRKEEEEARKREEEEAMKREEEKKKREEEEARKREEEEARRKEEKARKREEEEEARRREEEARKETEEEARKREEEEARKREEEEEEIQRQEQKEIRRQEEEAKERARKEEEKEARKREEEEARKREEEEQEIRRQEQKEIRRQEEEAKERATKEEEKEARKREEEEATKEEEKEARKREEEEARKREEEEEEIRRQEQKEIKRQEEAKEREEGGGNRKIEEASENKKGSSETSGGERVMWRKIWMA